MRKEPHRLRKYISSFNAFPATLLTMKINQMVQGMCKINICVILRYFLKCTRGDDMEMQLKLFVLKLNLRSMEARAQLREPPAMELFSAMFLSENRSGSVSLSQHAPNFNPNPNQIVFHNLWL